MTVLRRSLHFASTRATGCDVTTRYVDKNNDGPSYIIAIGEYQGRPSNDRHVMKGCVSLISLRDSRRGPSLLLHLTPSPFGHESHCPGEVHQGQSDPKEQEQQVQGLKTAPDFAIPPRPDMLSARRRHAVSHRELGMSTSLRLSRRGHHRPQMAGLSQNRYGHTYIISRQYYCISGPCLGY